MCSCKYVQVCAPTPWSLHFYVQQCVCLCLCVCTRTTRGPYTSVCSCVCTCECVHRPSSPAYMCACVPGSVAASLAPGLRVCAREPRPLYAPRGRAGTAVTHGGARQRPRALYNGSARRMLPGAAQAAGISSPPLAFSVGASSCLVSQPLLPRAPRFSRAPDSPQRSRVCWGSRRRAPSRPVWVPVPPARRSYRGPLPPRAPDVLLRGPGQRPVPACPPARTPSAFSARSTSAWVGSALCPFPRGRHEDRAPRPVPSAATTPAARTPAAPAALRQHRRHHWGL
ncbi:prokineticin-2 isoform X1 [Antechinus flavipes]|uniref:prokineticin-2 isoform X1 n=1 Tax=Antechinus flavipes TaxID=38775 RepID=UPI002235DCCE|nr:prokineticin-2 isoform X1 [Antechinus flavipes]